MIAQDPERYICLRNRQELSKLSLLQGHEPWRQVTTSAFDQLQDPSLSVLITLYNYAHHIEECLDSVVAALDTPGHPATEVLIIDDGSSDLSRLTVRRYLERHADRPLGLFCKTFNTGLADARNTGIQLSRAPLLFILDADNSIQPHCLIRLQEAMQDPEVAACYPIIRRFDDLTGESLGLLSQYDWSMKELVREPYIDAMAMFRRSVLEELDGYSLDFIYGWEDYDLWLRLGLGHYAVRQVPEILANYRVHKQSMVHQTNLRSLSIASAMRRRYVGLDSLYDPDDKLFGFSSQDYDTAQRSPANHASNRTRAAGTVDAEPGLGQLLQIAREKLSRRTARLLRGWYRRLKGTSLF